MKPERMWLDKDGKAFPDHPGFDNPSYSADLTLYVRADLVGERFGGARPVLDFSGNWHVPSITSNNSQS